MAGREKRNIDPAYAKALKTAQSNEAYDAQMEAEYQAHREMQEEGQREQCYYDMFKHLSDRQVINRWRDQTHPETRQPLTDDEANGMFAQWNLRFGLPLPDPDRVKHIIDDTAEDAEEAPSLKRKPIGEDAPILTPTDLAKFLGVSPSTIHRARKDGRIPEPAQISERKPCWSIKQAQDLKAAGFCKHYED